MTRRSLVARLDQADKTKVAVLDQDSSVSNLQFIRSENQLDHGIGQILQQLKRHQLHPSETAIDLAILAATLTAADTRISRSTDAQDSWTREIDLYLPVSNLDLWSENVQLIERMLRFLTGDLWKLSFRSRPRSMRSLVDASDYRASTFFDSVCLFSGGLDSFVGTIDLLEDKKNPIFVSHYKDASTKSQNICAKHLSEQYGDFASRHVRTNVSFDRNDLPSLSTETTTRGRSFIFLALAAIVADTLEGTPPIYVPENGLISLNVPLDPLRLGAWSTRTTHPFYMIRWQELLDNLGIRAKFLNPYRFKTKGEMLSECASQSFLSATYSSTVSCSSVTKARWHGQAPMHCGYCVPCLIRRASVNTAFDKDTTVYSLSDLNSRRLDAHHATSADIRAFQWMYRRLSKNPRLARVLVHKPGPLYDYSDIEVSNYADVFQRGIAEVGAMVETVQISSS
ncbi:MAG: hypothetical protein OXH31_09670 [Gammaproteobacteria bacterium]|nr:hypothetical protein [Gammaproteobacteria bacterium]